MEFFTPLDNMNPDERRAYLQEGLILDVTEQIWAALSEKGITRKDLAEALQTSSANVSQLLNGSRNMTLRTLSDIADAINCSVNVIIRDRDTAKSWRPLAEKGGWAEARYVTHPVKAANEWTTLSTVNG